MLSCYLSKQQACQDEYDPQNRTTSVKNHDGHVLRSRRKRHLKSLGSDVDSLTSSTSSKSILSTCERLGKDVKTTLSIAGSTISTLLHDKINPKDCQVLSLGDSGFLRFFRVVSSDYGKPRIAVQLEVLSWVFCRSTQPGTAGKVETEA